MPNIPVRAAATGLPASHDEYRALQLYDRIPAGHVGVFVTSTDWDPHLRQGEVAIVDTSDKSLEFGELFVIALCEDTPRMSLAIVQLLREEPQGLWYGFHLKENPGLSYQGQNLCYVDGPLRTKYWPEKCVGRIVGVSKPRWEGRR